MELKFNELRELVSVLNETDIEELTLKSDDFELTIRKGLKRGTPESLMWSEGMAPPSVVAPPVSPTMVPQPTSAADATSTVPTSSPTPTVIEQQLIDIMSPMVGTFYRSPAPDEPPFVDMGDRIRPGQTVCIIEAMKLMNELEAEVSGEVVEILVQNGDPVEYGQTLMRVKPN
ncbi:MAG: acetyl-CoA carboxylase biotin carboxyl carrier protein [Elainellaceae cyanobacterium]